MRVVAPMRIPLVNKEHKKEGPSKDAGTAPLRKHISIAFIGQIHRDPISFIVLGLVINTIHRKGIPLYFCMEDFEGQTYENWIKGNLQFLEFISLFFFKPEFQTIIKKDLSRPYITHDTHQQLKKIITDENKEISLILKNELIDALYRLSAIAEAINLVQNTLMKLSIPMTGIEYSKKEHESMRIKERLDSKMYVTLEQDRIKTMTDKIINNALLKLPADGIILVFGGVNHTHRLAANFWLRYTNDLDLQKKFNVKIFPMKLFSPYVKDGIPIYQNSIKKTISDDSSAILKLYDLLPCPTIMCNDIKPENKNDEKELPTELTKILNQMLQHATVRTTTFTIPDFNDSKKDVINRLNGKVIRINHQGKENHYASVEMNSDDLKKDIRELLGLDRKMITLTGSSAEINEKLKFLKLDKTITIEETSQINKFLITYPKNRQALIDKVCNQWQLLQSQKQAFDDKLKTSLKAYQAFLKIQHKYKANKSTKKSTNCQEQNRIELHG